MALIEIDALPIKSMVDLSMANCECHNQRVNLGNFTATSTQNSSIFMGHPPQWSPKFDDSVPRQSKTGQLGHEKKGQVLFLRFYVMMSGWENVDVGKPRSDKNNSRWC